jgi:hypothetical protein
MSELTETDQISQEQPKFVEGRDYYFENGLMVLTEIYLRNRGYCCGNLCRHCPYSNDEREAALKKKFL